MVHMKSSFYAVVLFLLLILVQTWSCWAQEIELKNLALDNQQGNIRVRFGLELDQPEEIRQALDDGSVLGLKCSAVLIRKRDVLWDEEVASATVLHQVKHNPLSREYHLLLADDPEPLRSNDLLGLLNSGWDRLEIGLGPWNRLSRGSVFVLDLTVSVVQMEVPDWVKTTLFFRSWEVVPETTYRLEFTY